MYNVALIGAGQLGSRHLQGLKLASSPLSIWVMDNNEESLRVSKERYDAVSSVGEKSINYLTDINGLPSQLDLVIVATGSKPRASIVKALLNHSSVRYLVLEKVLFPVLAEYEEIDSLLKEKQVKCWVNCSRRMFGLYQDVKELIDPAKEIEMIYADENWGICCNAIHIIDIFMYLTGEKRYNINVSGLNDAIEESRRGGYIEMTGTITVRTEHGHTLSLISENNYQGEKGIILRNGKTVINISEGLQTWTWAGVEHKSPMPYQSQMTGLLADELLITGGCPLPTYNVSESCHLPFIEALLCKYNELIKNINNKLLPIT